MKCINNLYTINKYLKLHITKMDYTLTELLTRDDMLRILNERQLKIPDLEMLPLDELKRIYKAFVTPLAKREPMSKRNIHNNTIAKNRVDASFHTGTISRDQYSQLQETRITAAMQEPTRTLCTQEQQAHSIVAMALIDASFHTGTISRDQYSQRQETRNTVAMQESTRTLCTQDQQAHSIVAMELESVSCLKNIPPSAQLPLYQKRRPHPITEEYLSKATKRIKIAWT